VADVLRELKTLADPRAVAGMRRFAIGGQLPLLGISVAKLRPLARRLGRDHELALALWNAGWHETRLLAALIADPRQVTARQMETWVKDFDSWDVCDGVCLHLFDRTPWAWRKAATWSGRRAEFVKRAGFVLMAVLAVHDQQAADEAFLPFLPMLVREATDDRNFVKKAVNWALRQIGKRSEFLRCEALRTAAAIRALDCPAARWIARAALREWKHHPPHRLKTTNRPGRRDRNVSGAS
jgi:3-methyladenine DNA glycosylase AlkD